MGVVRKAHYLITNFEEDAIKARDMARAGADWDDVVTEYHDGGPPPGGGDFVIDVPFGQYGSEFENPVFAAEVGGVTEPILTIYGWWVLRIDEEVQPKPGKKLDLEQSKAKILDTIYNRKIARIRTEFRKSVDKKYKLTINEDALWKAFQGLPADEVLLDPVTKKPTPKEDLKPLAIKPADMDMAFYSYEVDGEVTSYTLGDYKSIFDRMSVFQRPKKSEMLGSLRNKIQQELEKALMNIETHQRGLDQDPRVVSLVDEKLEEILVTKIYQDLVQYDDTVTPDQLQAFWNEHEDDYAFQEKREGHLVICLNEAQALSARASIEQGMAWDKVLVKYGTDRDNKSRGGRLQDITDQAGYPIRNALFSLPEGGISDPILVKDGRFAVVRCEGITPGRPATLVESSEAIGKRIKKQREEEGVQKLLDEWRAEFGVTIHEDALESLPSWDELVNPPLPGQPVPRNA